MANENMINAVRGTREFYPEQMMIRLCLYKKLQHISTAFGYQEYDGPFL